MSRRPNFLLFVTDQHRADHLGCYGNRIVRTPHIDSLAQAGTRFERFYVSSPVCMANRATLMTGRMPSLHGVRHNGIALSHDATTFVELLRAAGYDTALIGKSHLQNMGYDGPNRRKWADSPELQSPPVALRDANARTRQGPAYDNEWTPYWNQDANHAVKTPFYGFNRVDLCTFHGDHVGADYARWLEQQVPNSDQLRGKEHAIPDPRYRAPQAWRTRVPEHLYPTAYIAGQTREFLQTKADSDNSPFFLTCSFPDPHHPYTPPGRYWDMYDPTQVTLPRSFHERSPTELVAAVHRDTLSGASNREGYTPFGVSEREAREIIALTYGMITMIDDAIGSVLQTLEETGLADNTIVAFTSDHGDWMGDHGIMLKGPLHYQGLVRVPFIWKDPARVDQRNSTDQALAGTIDIAKTVLQRAGIASYNGIQGVDLFSALANQRAERSMVIESEQIMYRFGQGQPFRMRSLVDRRYRISVSDLPHLGELYDLEQDPDESHNKWNDPEFSQLKAHLLERLCREQIQLTDTSPLPTALA